MLLLTFAAVENTHTNLILLYINFIKFPVFGHTKSYIIRINLIVSNVVKNTLWINNTINRTVNIKNVKAHIIVKYVHLYSN